MKYLGVFTVPVTLALNNQQRDRANRLVNIQFLGRPELLSLEEEVSKEHEDAAYALCRHYTIWLEVGLLPDGRLEMIKKL